MDNAVSVVVLCAGRSSRMGGVDKMFLPIAGIPAVIRTLMSAARCKYAKQVIAVTQTESRPMLEECLERYGVKADVVTGGSERCISALNGAKAAVCRFVAITDGARPLIKPENIDSVCEAAFEFGAAALGVDMTDTVKRVDDGFICGTVDRSELVRIQSPQVFEREKYVKYAETALKSSVAFTDDCSILEHFGEKVKLVYGRSDNVKITVAEDVEMCSKLIGCSPVSVGHGYDVHKLAPERELWLCGEKIECDLGLLGHSDADVALHALIDAMLGAAAMGDIGAMFPDTDEKYRGISSIVLLKSAATAIFENYRFGNCDLTIIAQKPKLSPYIKKMKANIADALCVPADSVNVKATTEEGLGFTGAAEGIAAHAVCILYKK